MADRQAQLRVVTFNVLGPANLRWRERAPLITETLRRLEPDVVALQEVPIGAEPDAVHALVGPGYDVRGFARTAEDGVGGALATRRPHRLVGEIDQRRSPHSLPWAGTLLVEVDTDVGRVLVAHHKPSWQFGAEHEREQQAVAAARLIEQHADAADHALVLGDFDATPDAASLAFLRGRRSLDVWASDHFGVGADLGVPEHAPGTWGTASPP